MLVNSLLLFSLLSVPAKLDDSDTSMRSKTIRVFSYKGTCPGHPNTTIIYKDIHLSLVNRVNYVSLKAIAKSTLPNDLRIDLIIKRCNSREALDSCEKYQTIHIKHFCGLLEGENKPWSSFIQNSNPPISCPIKKGKYEINNATFDIAGFADLPITGWYWIVMAKVFTEDTNELVFCFKMEGKVVTV